MKQKSKFKILSVQIIIAQDSDGDSSYLGEFTSSSEDYAYIRHGEHSGKFVCEVAEDARPGQRGHHEHLYIVPTNHVPHSPSAWAHVKPTALAEVVAKYGSIEKADIEYARQDCERLDRLNDGHWWYVGVIAKAQIWNPETQQTQWIQGGGLWGVESYSSNEYFAEVGLEQLASLHAELEALGFGERAIKRAFENVETVNK